MRDTTPERRWVADMLDAYDPAHRADLLLATALEEVVAAVTRQGGYAAR